MGTIKSNNEYGVEWGSIRFLNWTKTGSPSCCQRIGFQTPHYYPTLDLIEKTVALSPLQNDTLALNQATRTQRLCFAPHLRLMFYCYIWAPNGIPNQLKMEFTGIFLLIKNRTNLPRHFSSTTRSTKEGLSSIQLICVSVMLLYCSRLVGFSTLSLKISLTCSVWPPIIGTVRNMMGIFIK